MKNQTNLFFLLFFISTSLSVVLAKNFLSKGSSVTVKDVTNSDNLLTSPDKTFSCGFHSIGTNAYWFSIWYANTKEQTVVWTANRDKPVNRQGSRVSLRRNGVMVLTDYDGATAWETNTTKLDNKRLVSRIGPQMFGSGYYTFTFDSDNVLRLMYDGPEISSIYWPDKISLATDQSGRSHDNNTRIAMLDDTGTFSSSDQLQFSASDVGAGIRRRLTLDFDGNMRVYSLNDTSGFWNITWQAVAKPCDVHGLCGRNGICVYTPEPRCSCPPNYEPTDVSDWNQGCKPIFHRSCSDSEFVEITHVDYYGYDFYRNIPSSYEDCRRLCLEDCRCQAFNYRLTGEAMCFLKNSLFNGFRSVDFPSSIYLRVPRSNAKPVMAFNVSRIDCGSGQRKIVVLPNTYDTRNPRFKWVYLYTLACVIGTLELILLAAGWWFLFRRHGLSSSMEDGYRAISNQFRSFSYSELKTATRNFKEVLGKGGFGVVYKGVLSDERVVAVKKLGDVVQGEEEFWAEVSIIGQINHLNLARMWGFCCEKKHRLLVYEHVEIGSLEKYLFSNQALLGWKERFKLHQRGSQCSLELTRIRGTKGYMAPEWARNLPITAKVDVYGYGVVILELVKGIRLSSRVVDDPLGLEEITELVRFVRLAKRKMQDGEDSWVDDFVDPRLEGNFSRHQAATIIEVGLSCVEDDRNKRPTMESVVQVLEECEDEI
ncbi:hypothetical protein BVRB_3g058400 [Beta vulgaris subsp. vulgaris]|nr:hypothetical protein BVRB_3g058400 [Beta vulgaris subsp. vulgaris]